MEFLRNANRLAPCIFLGCVCVCARACARVCVCMHTLVLHIKKMLVFCLRSQGAMITVFCDSWNQLWMCSCSSESCSSLQNKEESASPGPMPAGPSTPLRPLLFHALLAVASSPRSVPRLTSATWKAFTSNLPSALVMLMNPRCRSPLRHGCLHSQLDFSDFVIFLEPQVPSKG